MSNFMASIASLSSPPLPSVVDDKSSNKKDFIGRHTKKFEASIWGDQFLTYDKKEDIVMEKEKQHIEELKKEVRKELMIKASNEPMQHMKLIELIDVVQRLGIGYHFEEEIEEALQHIHITYGEQWIENNNLQNISLWFRILRQQGYNVSSGVFKNHIDEKGDFKESLCKDAKGLLGLYEASYMRVEGEKVLDDALEFTKFHLGKIVDDPSSDSSLRTHIQEALHRPLRKRLPRLEALHFIPFYEQDASHNEVLLKLAKLDFNVVQSLHKKELSQICKWWKGLDMETNLPYVRDRLIEGFFWILAIYFEPQHSRTRMFLIRSCIWIVVLDDTYDNFGTYEELEIFTEAVQRWSRSCLDILPEYMKLVYQEILDVHQEMEEVLEKEGKAYHIDYVKEMAKEYTRNSLVEAKWLRDGHTPTFEEHMSVSMVTSAHGMILGRSYVGRGDMVTEETFKWVATFPPLVKATCWILRLMDDIASHKEEQERGHVASSIECYENETGASEEEAREFISKQAEDQWKVVNRETLRPTYLPFSLVTPAINLARVCDVLYKRNNDSFSHAGEEMRNYIKSLFVHPMVI